MLPYNKSIILLPTYNEIDNIEDMLIALTALSPDLSILVLDDGSPDGTADVVKKMQAGNDHINLLQRSGKQGLGKAYLAGFKWALENSFDSIFEIDCDFSHDPKDVPRLLEAAQTHDLAIGSRYIGGIRIINWPIHRLLLSYGASIYIKLVTSMKINDPTGGFKCFTRKALESLQLDKIL